MKRDDKVIKEQTGSSFSFPPKSKSSIIYARFFWGLILAFAAILFAVDYDCGYHSDELGMMAFGRANIDFYASGESYL
jgi:hypothetical protein